MSKNFKTADGTVVSICEYSWTDPDGHIETCKSHAKCPICRQCSRITDGKELGHCPGHKGLLWHINDTVPNRGTV